MLKHTLDLNKNCTYAPIQSYWQIASLKALQAVSTKPINDILSKTLEYIQLKKMVI